MKKVGSLIKTVVMVAGWIIVGSFICPVFAADYYLKADGTGDFPTLKSALQAAVSGDTIWCHDGTYTYDTVNLTYAGKALVVRSLSDDPTTCIIDCQSIYNCLKFVSGEGNTSILRGVTIRNGFYSNGGAILCEGTSPLFINCRFTNNIATGKGGAVLCSAGAAPIFEACVFEQNWAIGSNALGGAIAVEGASLTLSRCILGWNYGTGTIEASGAGIFVGIDGSADLSNCALLTNVVEAPLTRGGAICCLGGEVKLMNCTLVGNDGGMFGGGLSFDALSTRSSELVNTLIWGNLANSGAQIYTEGGEPAVSYCLVEGGWSGLHNISLNPLLDLDDYHLTVDSPCIETGTNVLAPSMDIDGHERPVGCFSDIGCVEYQELGNGDTCLDATRLKIPNFQSGISTHGLSDSLPAGSPCGVAGEDRWFWIEPAAINSSGTITVTISNEVGPDFYVSVFDGCGPDAQCLSTDTQSVTVSRQETDLYVVIDGGEGWFDLEVFGCYAELRVPQDVPTLAEALAWPCQGTVITLADGTYYGAGFTGIVPQTKDFTLLSENGDPTACVIDCLRTDRVFVIAESDNSEITIQGITMKNGYEDQGGAISCSGCSLSLLQCVFSGNTAYQEGGAISCSNAELSLVSCQFLANRAGIGISQSGGAVYCADSELAIESCVFVDNTARSDGGALLVHQTTGTILTTQFSGNSCLGNGGAVYSGAATMTLHDCTFTNNVGSSGGGLSLNESSCTLTSCDIAHNHSYEYSAGLDAAGCQLTLAETTIRDNWVSFCLGSYCGFRLSSETTAEMINCLIVDNYCDTCGAAYPRGPAGLAINSTLTMIQCTVADHTSTSPNGAPLMVESGSIVIHNSIVWGNTADELPASFYLSSGTVTTTYSDIEGGWVGEANIDIDPLFVGVDDYGLSPESPCIDRANPEIAPTIDIEGDARPQGALPDMGSDEVPFFGLADSCETALQVACPFIREELATSFFSDQAPAALACGYAGPDLWFKLETAEFIPGMRVTAVLGNEQTVSDFYVSILNGCDPEADCLVSDSETAEVDYYSGELYIVVDGATGLFDLAISACPSSPLLVPSQASTIQHALTIACPDTEIVVADGTYTGEQNKNLDFLGKRLTLRSASRDPDLCIIDCEGDGRGFLLQNNETSETVIEGFAIINGDAPDGGGIKVIGASPTIKRCTISENYASSGNGGGVYSSNGSPTLVRCAIKHNSAYQSGGGAYILGGAWTLENCVFWENHAETQQGGAWYASASNMALLNCNILNNEGWTGAGGVFVSDAPASLMNCIVWGNTVQGIPSHFGVEGLAPVIAYSDVQNGYDGPGNFSETPFLASDGITHLVGSPCIDAGNNAETPDEDWHGNLRPQGALVDLGPDEFVYTGNGDTCSSPIILRPFCYNSVATDQFTDSAPAGVACGRAGADIWFQLDTGNVSQGDILTISIGNETGTDLSLSLLDGCDPAANCITSQTSIVSYTVPSYNPTLYVIVDGGYGQADLCYDVCRVIFVPSEVPTIQEGILAAEDGDKVVVADGTYTGVGNTNLTYEGKAIEVRSASLNPAACVIDCGGSGRGFAFTSGEGSDSVVQGFTIRNGANENGCGIYCSASSPTVINCKLSNHNSGASQGAGAYIRNSSATFMNCEFLNNTATGANGGGAYMYRGSPQFINCAFVQNYAGTSGGGGLYNEQGSVSVSGCTFSGNLTPVQGAANRCVSGSIAMENCLVINNIADGQYAATGGVHLVNSTGTVKNCTFYGNQATNNTGGLFSSWPISVFNCIFRNDTVGGVIDEVDVAQGSSVSFCNVHNGYNGIGNINANPLFISSSDFHLQANSPCIDAGTNLSAPDIDLDGEFRPQGIFTDMGCYEVVFTGKGDTCAAALNLAMGVKQEDAVTAALSDAAPAGQICSYAGADAWFFLNTTGLVPGSTITALITDEQGADFKVSLLAGCNPLTDCLDSATSLASVIYTSAPIYIVVDGGFGTFDLVASDSALTTATPIPTPTLTPAPPTETPLPATPTPQCLHTGDTTLNGQISAGDAQLAFYIAAGYLQPTYQQACAADCNGDEQVSAGDAQQIFGLSLGLLTCVDQLAAFDYQAGNANPEELGKAAVPDHTAKKPGNLQVLDSESGPDNLLRLVTKKVAETIQVRILLDHPSHPVDCFTVELTFDPAYFSYVDCAPSDVDPGWTMFGCAEPKPGVIRVSAFAVEREIPAGHSGVLVELNFSTVQQGIANLDEPEFALSKALDDLEGFRFGQQNHALIDYSWQPGSGRQERE